MQVETFECQETAAEPIEATEEAVRLIEELGLEGQLSLVRPRVDGAPAARCPYRQITAEEQFVYETLCPTKYDLGLYSASPIPLRVLQIAAHVKSLGIVKRLEVWDKETSLVQDPVLVGHIHDRYEYDSSKIKTFILARWGEVLETFSTLKKQAIGIHRDRLLKQAETCLAHIGAAPDDELMQHRSVGW